MTSEVIFKGTAYNKQAFLLTRVQYDRYLWMNNLYKRYVYIYKVNVWPISLDISPDFTFNIENTGFKNCDAATKPALVVKVSRPKTGSALTPGIRGVTWWKPRNNRMYLEINVRWLPHVRLGQIHTQRPANTAKVCVIDGEWEADFRLTRYIDLTELRIMGETLHRGRPILFKFWSTHNS